MKKKSIAIALFAVAIALWLSLRERALAPIAPALEKTYASSQYRVSFKYPAHYFLEEKDIELSHRIRHQIILTEDTEENKSLREGEVRAGEGPVSITIDIFQNNLDHQDARSFITGAGDSNYKLGNGLIATTTHGSVEGLEYAWSGLYEGVSFVSATDAFIYMFSVTWLTPQDRIIADYDAILKSVAIK